MASKPIAAPFNSGKAGATNDGNRTDRARPKVLRRASSKNSNDNVSGLRLEPIVRTNAEQPVTNQHLANQHLAEQRFAEFVTRSRDQLLRALRATLLPEFAVEALADAYAYAWTHWDHVSTLTNPVGYVYRVAERSGTRAEMRDRKHTIDSTALTNSTAPTEWFDAYQSDDQTIELLRALPQRQRACVLLIHAYGWSYKETADMLSLPLTTVTNEATRGLQRLRTAADVLTKAK
jgi:DNA-directed RNA polymerase specialized sigma24 family protein